MVFLVPIVKLTLRHLMRGQQQVGGEKDMRCLGCIDIFWGELVDCEFWHACGIVYERLRILRVQIGMLRPIDSWEQRRDLLRHANGWSKQSFTQSSIGPNTNDSI